MKTRFLSRFFIVVAAAMAVFPLVSSAQEASFAKANITVVNGVLTINEDDPTVLGLLFKYGSVVGVSSGEKNYQKFNSETDILFDPTYPAQAPYNRWKDIPYTKNTDITHDHSNVLLGKGDPCRLADAQGRGICLVLEDVYFKGIR